jgi:hypothetical protein
MAHFAKLDENNIVVGVYVVGDEYEETYAESRLEFDEVYVQTSYNNNIRKQYAGIGYRYDAINDVFIAPQPYPSWSLDNNFDWQPPTPRPEEGDWRWDENSLTWLELYL